MAQFDVYRNPSKTTRKFYPYLLDIQSPYISDLATRIVIPLGLVSFFKNESMDILTPEITFEEEGLLLLTPQMSSMPSNLLKEPVGTLVHFRDQIINAVDFAISGV
ncbi:CcdB family protein [Marinomonas transparens]|uniref:Toxin CcdB n=1 Tax=Marinomonas transparens TaxID=2795388 RepID=A0A934JS05_9GAMM|nr:CcdB family protein [Marinomonas transparens]MBJ7537216.1 CcdB family protein [Marinomonas transparens]